MGGRRSDDVSWPLVEHRLSNLEQSFKDEFRILHHRLDTLGATFVRRDVYDSDLKLDAERFAAIREDIDDIGRRSWWAVSLIAGSLFVALVGVIGRLAGFG